MGGTGREVCLEDRVIEEKKSSATEMKRKRQVLEIFKCEEQIEFSD